MRGIRHSRPQLIKTELSLVKFRRVQFEMRTEINTFCSAMASITCEKSVAQLSQSLSSADPISIKRVSSVLQDVVTNAMHRLMLLALCRSNATNKAHS